MPSNSRGARGTLYLGDFHPTLERLFADRLASLAPAGDARAGWVVVPNRYLAVHLRRRAAELGTATFGLEVIAIEDLARRLAAPALAAAGIRPLGAWQALFVAEEIGPYLSQPLFAETFYFQAAARTPGLTRALSATIRDLRDARVEPAELARAAAALGSSERKVRELADLYQRFTEALTRRRLADSRRVSDAAAHEVESGRAALPEWLLLYGIYDLTARQRHLLSRLLAAVPVDAFVPWFEGPAASYASPVREWLEAAGLRAFTDPEQEPSEPEPDDDALARLRRGVFSAPAAQPVADDDSVRFLSAPEPEREAREVLRRVAAESGRVAVLLRGRGAPDQHYRALVASGSLDLHLPGGEPWRRTACGRAALTLIELAAGRDSRADLEGESLPRARVEDLLTSGALSPKLFERGAVPGRWTQLLRRLGVISGVASWRRLAALSGSESKDDEGVLGGEGLGRPLARELPALSAWVERLLADTEALRREPKSWATLARNWRSIFERWLVPSVERDGLLAGIDALADLEGVVRVRWRTAREAFEEALASPRKLGGRFGGVPSVGDLMALRGVTFDHVTLPALVERSFPRRARQDPILLDDERVALNAHLEAAGSPARLTLKVAPAAAEERFLFRQALGCARRSVLLSWPRAGDDGRPLVPSTFVLEAASTLAGVEAGFALLDGGGAEGGGVDRVEQVPLAPPYPEGSSLPRLSSWEFDLERVDLEREKRGDGSSLAYLDEVYPRFAAGFAAEEKRGGWETRGRLTEFDGLVAPSLAQAWLEKRAEGREAPRLSASALEAYGRCSFHFFHREMLRIDSEAVPERRLGGDPRRLGGLYHRLLFELYQRLDAQGLLPLEEGRLEEGRRLARATLGEVLAEEPLWIAEGPEAFWRARQRRIAGDLERVLEADVAAGDGAVPVAFEVALGGDGAAPVLRFGEREVALSGRVDRVDRVGEALRVIDYKTGAMPARRYRSGDLHDGQRLQLALYARAVGALGVPGATASTRAEGVYSGVTRASDHRRLLWSAEDLAAASPELDRLVEAMLDGIAAGELYQVERGRFCDAACSFVEICGPARPRRVEEKSADPRVARSWRRVPEEES